MMNETIGIIGFGNMGQAIAARLKADYKIFVFDKDRNKTRNLIEINVADNIADLLKQVKTVILAVKPQDFDTVLEEIKNYAADKLIISIAAGITTVYIEKSLGEAKVIRVMPNMPARLGKGVTCLCKGRFASREDLNFTQKIFDYLGKTLILKEEMMDAATAISGSGPGYYFYRVENNPREYKNNPDKFLKNFIEDLKGAALTLGFSEEEAGLLSSATGTASDFMLAQTQLPAAQLKQQVASKGGTTEAALEVLKRNGSLKEAVQAAYARAKQLAKRS